MTIGAVEIRAGFPSRPSEELDDGTFAYPYNVIDFAKILREHGFDVEYEHPKPQRSAVSLKAADVWLPILSFTTTVLSSIPADIISSMILSYLGQVRLSRSTLHVEFKVKQADGTETSFRANGPGPDVINSINAFQQKHRP